MLHGVEIIFMFGSYPPTVDKSYRTSKLGQKLVLFPESDGDKLIIDSAKDSEETFRVSSYCISEQMDLDSITLYLSNYHIVLPHKYDECLYFYYDVEARERVFGTTAVHRSEIFIFDYGVIVMWNLSKDEEQRFIDTMAPFTKGLLNPNDIDSEELSFLYDISEFTQPRIFNDVITLIPTNPYNPLVKLTISHGLGQSVKLAFFENIMEETIISTVSLPKTLAQRGKVNMNRTEMMMIIGKLYRLKMNVNLISNVLGYLKLTQILRRFSGLSLGLKICIRPFAVR
jgi:uncharacterized Rmd1/YagE family protein